jgi:hypothetical protein
MTPFLDGVERIVLLRDGLRSADRAVARRAAMVAAAGGGEPLASVARRFGRSPGSVERWVRLYKKHRDIRALGSAQSSGGLTATTPQGLTPAFLATARAGHRRKVAPKLSPSATRAVRLLVMTSSDPGVRLRAAIVWAVERGIPPVLVALASGRSRQAIHQLWGRWSRGGE